MARLIFKLDELGSEIAQIALPAALALTADPVASLVDTAFIGQIGIFHFPLLLRLAYETWNLNEKTSFTIPFSLFQLQHESYTCVFFIGFGRSCGSAVASFL